MKDPFEVMPLLAAVIIGALVLTIAISDIDQNAAVHGAVAGGLVQIGVRLLGVS